MGVVELRGCGYTSSNAGNCEYDARPGTVVVCLESPGLAPGAGLEGNDGWAWHQRSEGAEAPPGTAIGTRAGQSCSGGVGKSFGGVGVVWWRVGQERWAGPLQALKSMW